MFQVRYRRRGCRLHPRGLAGIARWLTTIDTRWLRTADVLRRLADHYEEEARNRKVIVDRRADMDYF
ncbi:MAG: hypothetical protein F4X74_13140 [Acidimicrobiia bacterium]|nr:hypothetical protein [Acidimicrobiia bacterium]